MMTATRVLRYDRSSRKEAGDGGKQRAGALDGPPHHPVGVGRGEGAQAPEHDPVAGGAVSVAFGPHLEAQGAEFQVQGPRMSA